MKHVQFEIDEGLHRRIKLRLLYENRRMKEYFQKLMLDDMDAYEATRQKKATEERK